jgi:hypothetical protein
VFGGHDQGQVYPPAPKGFRYVDMRVPQAPPGYHTERMSHIASNPTGLPTGSGVGTHRQSYQYNAHTPEGIKERALESMRLSNAARELKVLQNPGYRPRVPISPSGVPIPGASVSQTGADAAINAPAVLEFLKSGGMGPAPVGGDSFIRPNMGSIPIPPPATMAQKLANQRRDQTYSNTVQKILDRVANGDAPVVPGMRPDIESYHGTPVGGHPIDEDRRGPEPSHVLDPTPGSGVTTPSVTSPYMQPQQNIPLPRDRPSPNIPLPQPRPRMDLLKYLQPLPGDTTQSHMDSKVMGTPEQEADWKWAEGIAREQEQKNAARPGIIQRIWETLTAPAGPAFNPANVDLNEQRYDPLPEGGTP